VIVTGMEKVAPWQPGEDAELMEAAPGRSIDEVVAGWMTALRPVWLVNVTPVVVQPGCPPSAVTVPPEPTTLTTVTATLPGLVTSRVTSPEPPGSSGVLGLTVAEEIVTGTRAGGGEVRVGGARRQAEDGADGRRGEQQRAAPHRPASVPE
jgi:hypothetical protein